MLGKTAKGNNSWGNISSFLPNNLKSKSKAAALLIILRLILIIYLQRNKLLEYGESICRYMPISML